MRAVSMTKPRAFAYSMNVALIFGAMLSAVSTMADIWSGMTTGKTPPK